MSASLDTAPDLLSLHRLDPGRYPFLLESTAAGQPRARYDILFVASGEHLTLQRGDRLEAEGADIEGGDFIASLDRWWRSLRRERGDAALPFHGGWFLFLSYELAAQIEPRLRPSFSSFRTEPTDTLPVASAVRCPAALIRDRLSGRTHLVAEPGRETLVETIHADIRRVVEASASVADGERSFPIENLHEDDPQRFIDGVGRVQRYIAEGDVFQVNLSRGWSGRLPRGIDDADLYQRLRTANPAPFSALARLGEAAVISSSPERLVSMRAGTIETRPIAGTRPRGGDEASDRELAQALLAHPKERAEHIMLIDLERNDLGRVCEPGSIRVDELMTVESYAHVHHIVSNVRGRLRAGIGPGEVIRAVFPGGTITGCPKVRCMEIIAELEQCARGAYTGAVGYLGLDGDVDLNILIRTLVRSGDRISLRTGAGIVADSIAEKELDETRAKARGLLKIFHEASA